MRRLYCLFIDREDIKQSLQIILQAIDQIKNGISVCIFPEGTDNCFENSFPWIKSTKVTLKYGTPIDPKALSKDEQKKIGAYTQTIISDMLKEICS